MLTEYDKKHFADILAGNGDWFTAQLMRLIAKASHQNRELLRLGFPAEVAFYERWLRGDG